MEAADWAPSPLNMQPWEFIVVTNPEVKEKIYSEAERCREWALEKSGWKWLGGYKPRLFEVGPRHYRCHRRSQEDGRGHVPWKRAALAISMPVLRPFRI